MTEALLEVPVAAAIPLFRALPSPLRAAVVGLGKQSLEDHIPALVGNSDVELVAVCDPDGRQVHALPTGYDGPMYRDVSHMIEVERPNFLVVAVPHHAGGQVVEAAARAGVHVMKEKPFATNLDEARRLAELCKKSGIELMVTLQRRFNPIYSTFPQLLDQIGRTFFVEGTYTMNVDPAAGWRGSTAKAGGGCIIDMGYHMIDMLLWYFGLPDRVSAQFSAVARPDLEYDAEDTASISFSYDSGPFGTLLLSRCISPKTERLRAYGTRGAVDLERGKIRRLSSSGDVLESLTREQAWPSAAATQVDHFCRVLRSERVNVSSPTEHLAHAAFVQACYTSRATGGVVNPKEFLA